MSNVRRLPGPNADVWDWQMDGLCRGRDSAQFFHPDGERGSARARREMAAKTLCRTCPVRPECAAQSLAAREPYGVWGGFTETERLRLLAIGWQDAWHRYRRRVDVGKLEAKLSREITRTFVGKPTTPDDAGIDAGLNLDAGLSLDAAEATALGQTDALAQLRATVSAY